MHFRVVSGVVFFAAFLFSVFISSAHAAAVTVNCSGTSGSPTAVDEASLTSDDVTFSDAGGDGYCVLDNAITVTSVVIEDGVILTHVAEDSDGVSITTTGDFTLAALASLNADEKGCGASKSPDGGNVCADNGTAAGTGEGAKAGGGFGGGGGGYAGAGGNGEGGVSGGGLYGDATAPIFHGSGGGEDDSDNLGASAGGYVRLSIGGTATINGSISVDGGDSSGCGTNAKACGGPSGGSIYITTSVIAGTGSFSAEGGNGENDTFAQGGGGSGGRIAITYATSTFDFDSSDFAVNGGTTGGTATSGSDGSVYVKDTDNNSVTVYHGFTYAGDYSETSWVVDSSATAQNCTTGDLTPSVSAATLVFGGTLTCAETFTSFNWASSSSFSILSGSTMSITGTGTAVDFTIVDGDDQTWTNFTFTGGAEGFFTIDDVVGVSLVGTTVITANVQWTNLDQLDINSTSSISANGLGCGASESPNGSNVCANNGTAAGSGEGAKGGSGAGGGGGGHGGNGGDGEGGASGGSAYGSSTAPVLFGSGGGESNSNEFGDARAGGLIRLQIDGTATIAGNMTADGQDQGDCSSTNSTACGGPSGGSIYVTATTIAGAGATFTAVGGDGQNDSFADGGGGGGGRIAVVYGIDSSDYLSGMAAATVVAGGVGPDAATDGATGTLYVADGIGPSISLAAVSDNDGNGEIDTVYVITNEDVDLSSIAGSDFSLSGGYAISGATASNTVTIEDGYSGAQINLTITESGTSDTNQTPTVSIVGSIDDSSGNSTTSGSATSLDVANAAIVSISPTDGQGGVEPAADVVVTFSEPINTGVVSYTLSETPSDLTTAWTVGNTVLTFSTSDGFTSGETITLQFTAADDVAGNSIQASPSLVGGDNTFAFTIAAAGGSVSASVTVLSPNGGETFTAGEDATIDWTWVGGTNNARTQIYYSLDGGGSYSLVKDYYNGTVSEYEWTVPEFETEQGLVKIVRSESGYTVTDYSNQVFAIQASSVDAGSGSEDSDSVIDEGEEDETEVVTNEDAILEDDGTFTMPAEARSPYTGEIEDVEQVLQVGDLITSWNYSSVYYLDEDGTRRPFFNETFFFTYYDSFDEVKVVSDATLSVLPLGSPMLPKSGVVLVKIESDPRVYAVDGTTLHWVPDEETAEVLYGMTWSDYVIDIPATFMARFSIGEDLSKTSFLEDVTMKTREALTH